MKHTAEVKLRPARCPLCGTPARVIAQSKGARNFYVVYCPSTTALHSLATSQCDTEAEAIAAWNTRPQHDRLVEVLRKALVFCEAEQECRETSCLPEPTKDEEPYLEDASETVDLLRAALAAEDAYESEVGK
jgi:hypothetical protein